ncbi:RDD family protein [Mucilaginibacter panaciglaebae]|uniref:RDD domain-containing protein n=1 Tax=Mucilaginibacter panaciglaebae TaxID=502331 RepID=A0ABP7WS12_9SPHI
MNEEYYIIERGLKKGPYTFSEIMQMDIDIHTEVITASNDKTQYASELSELNEYFESKGIYFPTVDNLAGFGKRAGAFFIDYVGWYILLSNIILRTSIVALPAAYRFGDPVPPEMLKLSLLMLGSFLVYNTICEATGLKGSFGKKILRLMVVDIDGQRLSFARAFLRNLGVVLSITIWIPFLSVLFSEHRQAWYDSWAKTYVIKTN